jgi:Flp pilus assembly pilin Flp
MKKRSSPIRPDRKLSLIRDKRGGTDFVEKLILIGFFALAVIAGVKMLGEKATEKFQEQSESVEQIPGGPTGG